MSGSTSYLTSGAQLVVDTQVWTDAALHDRATLPPYRERERVEEAHALFERITEVCPEIRLSKHHTKQLITKLRQLQFRTVFSVPLFGRLNDKDKLREARRSQLRDFDVRKRAVFEGPNRNDVFLYEAAAAFGKVVITNDDNLLKASKKIEKAIGVETISITEALESA